MTDHADLIAGATFRAPMRITDEGIIMQATQIEEMIADALKAADDENAALRATIAAARESLEREEHESIAIALLAAHDAPAPVCICDGGKYQTVEHPFIVNADCKIHGRNR